MSDETEKIPQLCGDTIRTSVFTSWKSVEGGIVLMRFKINNYVDIYFFNGGIKGGGVRSQFFLLLESFVHSYSRSGLKARSLKEEVKRKLCDYNGPQSPDTGHTVIYD